MGWISLKRTPNFLAVNVQNPDAQKYMRLTIRNSESEPLIFNLFALIAQYDRLKLAALKADGSYYQVSVSGKRFLPKRRMKMVTERTYLDNKPAFLIYKQDTHQRKLSSEQSTHCAAVWDVLLDWAAQDLERIAHPWSRQGIARKINHAKHILKLSLTPGLNLCDL